MIHSFFFFFSKYPLSLSSPQIKDLQTGTSSFFDLSYKGTSMEMPKEQAVFSAGHLLPLLVMRFGSHETQEPGRSALHSSLPKQQDMVHAPPQVIHGEEIILTTELVQKRSGERGIFSLYVCKITVTSDRQARYLVTLLRLRTLSSFPKVINHYLCEILQGTD